MLFEHGGEAGENWLADTLSEIESLGQERDLVGIINMPDLA